MSGNNQLPPSIERWLTTNKLKLEIWLSGIVLISMLLHYAKVPGGEEAIMISMSVLAGVYFLIAYTKSDLESMVGLIAHKILSIGSSVCVIGMLFSSLHLTGASEMMMIGFPAVILSGIILAVKALAASASDKLPPLIIRAAVIAGILLAIQLF